MTPDRQDGPQPDGNAPAPEAESPVMTTRQACNVLHRTPRTLRNWERRGYLHPVRVHGSVYYRRDEVMALIEERNAP
jgi:hypothetical protein